MLNKHKLTWLIFMGLSLSPTLFQAQSAYGFIENKGQIVDQNGHLAEEVRFLLPLENGLNVQLRNSGFSYDTYTSCEGEELLRFHRIDIEWLGGNPEPSISASAAAPDILHFIGSRQATGVRHFQKITYHDIYPGIDVEFWSNPGSDKPVEYNFLLRPGASVQQIKLRYTGAVASGLDKGEVTLQLAHGTLRDKIPAAWAAQSLQPVAVRYQLLETLENSATFGFETDAPQSEGLIIDPQPVLSWGTYLGGGGADGGRALTLDAASNVFVTGTTRSLNAIATVGTHQTTLGGAEDVLVAKFDTDGTRLWATYFGGTGNDLGQGIALDAQGNVYVSGVTDSPTAIATAGAQQPTYGGSIDAFIAKFDLNGLLVWSTYLGGNEEERNNHIAVQGNRLCTTGWTRSQANIASPGAYQTTWMGNFDAYLALYNLDGQQIWNTYFGSDGWDLGLSVAFTNANEIAMSGWTSSNNNIASPGAHQTIYGGGTSDAFLAKFDLNGNRVWATYYGGANDDYGDIVAASPAGDIFIGGPCASPDNMTTPGTFQPNIGGGYDAFLAKFDPNGIRQWGTYHGGSGDDTGYGIAFRGTDVYLCGFTNSANNIATPNAHQTINGGGLDAYLVKFDQFGFRQWSSYYGGSADDYGYQIGVDADENVYMVGITYSDNGISTSGAHQEVFGGGNSDLFVAKFSPCSPSTVNVPNGGWLCRSKLSNFVLQFDFAEPGNYIIYWDADGIAQPPLVVNSNPYFWAYSGNWQDSVRITAIEVNGCNALLGGLPFARIAPANEVLDTTITCLPDLSYTLTAELAGGVFGNFIPIPISAGFVNGTTFTSTPIPSGQPFLIGFTSGLYCDTVWVSGNQACTCSSNSIFAGNPQQICQGESVVLNASGGISYVWDNGVQNGVPFTPTATAVYTVTGTDANGCTASATATIAVNQPPAITVAASAASICAGENVALTASGATNYVWDNGVQNGVPFTPTATAVYTVTGTDANGCTTSTTATIAVNPIPTARITGNPSVCAGSSIPLSASGGNSYLWSTGQTTAAIVVSPLSNATYSVTVSIDGCSNQANIEITVLPVPSVTVSAGLLTQSGTVLTASGASNYQWSPSEGLSCSNCPTTNAAPQTEQVYCVTGEEGGCTGTACVAVGAVPSCNLYVPNVFAPSSPYSENSAFCVFGNCIESERLHIYDRWGELLFEGSGRGVCWDGMYRGKPMLPGVYIYWVEIRSIFGETSIKTGDFTLLR